MKNKLKHLKLFDPNVDNILENNIDKGKWDEDSWELSFSVDDKIKDVFTTDGQYLVEVWDGNITISLLD
jgi:hypothetical protein